MECWDAKNEYTHTRMAYLLFNNFHVCQCHLVTHVAFRVEAAVQAEVPPIRVEVRWFVCVSRISVGSLVRHFTMECCHVYDIYKPLPPVYLSQPSPFDDQETELLASSLLRLQHKVS